MASLPQATIVGQWHKTKNYSHSTDSVPNQKSANYFRSRDTFRYIASKMRLLWKWTQRREFVLNSSLFKSFKVIAASNVHLSFQIYQPWTKSAFHGGVTQLETYNPTLIAREFFNKSKIAALKGKPSFKQIHFMKKLHKTMTHSPSPRPQGILGKPTFYRFL